MRRMIFFIMFVLAACAPASTLPTVVPTALPITSTPAATLTPTAMPTETPAPSPTAAPVTATPAPVGPQDYPPGVNPLTGLPVADPALLERRPVIVKVSNMPRSVRPQWGLSRADLVFEYYTEYGSTRFAAIFYGQNAEMVGPVRSGRFVDAHLIRMYQGLFAFGSADYRVRQRLYNAEFADRLFVEWGVGCPGLCRYEPDGANHLVADTLALTRYADANGIENQRPDLSGMLFSVVPPAEGRPAEEVRLHYSLSVYNRWVYDAAAGRYFRWVDTREARLEDEEYTPLADRLTGEPIGAENVLVLFVPHEYYSVSPEIMDIQLTGSGRGYLFRDGQAYAITWRRPDAHRPLQFFVAETNEPIALKPGQSWFELLGIYSQTDEADGRWQFIFGVP